MRGELIFSATKKIKYYMRNCVFWLGQNKDVRVAILTKRFQIFAKNSVFPKNFSLERSKVAPRLTETRVGGGYPESSDPEWTGVRSRVPGYLGPWVPGCPMFYYTHTLLIHWKENDERYATHTIPLPADADLLYHERRDG